MYRLLNKSILCFELVNKNAKIFFFPKLAKKWMSTAASDVVQSASLEKKKGFVVYHNPRFSVTFARIAAIFGITACSVSIFITYDLQNAAKEAEPETEPEVSEKSPSGASSLVAMLYEGKASKVLPAVYALTGVVFLSLARKYVNSTVTKLMLSADKTEAIFITHSLFGKDKIRTFPIQDITFERERVKVKNFSSSYFFMKSGTITNEPLFNFTLNKNRS